MLGTKVDMKSFIGKRKHVSQMSNDEIGVLFKRLKHVEENGLQWRMTTHTLDRIKNKKIDANYQDLVSLIHNSKIVEYKIDENKFDGEPEERVVLSSNSVVNNCYKLKVVYSITKRRIVTAWVNHVKDNHDTLDWGLYSAEMPVYNF